MCVCVKQARRALWRCRCHMRVGFEKIKIWNVSCFRLGFYHLLSVDAADKVLFNDIILALSKFTVHIFAPKRN